MVDSVEPEALAMDIMEVLDTMGALHITIIMDIIAVLEQGLIIIMEVIMAPLFPLYQEFHENHEQ